MLAKPLGGDAVIGDAVLQRQLRRAAFDPEVAIREYIIRRIGEDGLRRLDDFMVGFHCQLAEELDGNSSPASAALVRELADVARRAFVEGFMAATGKKEKPAGNPMHELVRRMYADSKGMKQSERIATIMRATGASRATVYRVLNLGR